MTTFFVLFRFSKRGILSTFFVVKNPIQILENPCISIDLHHFYVGKVKL